MVTVTVDIRERGLLSNTEVHDRATWRRISPNSDPKYKSDKVEEVEEEGEGRMKSIGVTFVIPMCSAAIAIVCRPNIGVYNFPTAIMYKCI